MRGVPVFFLTGKQDFVSKVAAFDWRRRFYFTPDPVRIEVAG
jgi:hypothetical protein